MNSLFFRAIVSLGLLWSAGMLCAEEKPAVDILQSEHYQLVKLTHTKILPARWDEKTRSSRIDMRNMKPFVEGNPSVPDAVQQYVSRITENYTKTLELRDRMLRDDTVYYSDYWTRKGSLLNIVEYQKHGSTTGLTAYLGPLSKIPLGSFGMARFELHHKGETMSFWGAVQRKGFSLRSIYWSGARFYLPHEENSPVDIAIVTQDIPTNYAQGADVTLLLVPRLP